MFTNSNNEKKVLFDMIDHLEDPTLRRKYLITLKDIVLDQQLDNKEIIEPFTMKNVLNKFKEHKSKTMIQDRQTELLYVKKNLGKLIKD